ncbi:MAG: phosphotransferase [Proteobacteria bacterium]|nr:phosphotransferase [Pseudomonadota bacterium]MCP4916333.1 phosphotransferase [Pseudomonadota bacterium]
MADLDEQLSALTGATDVLLGARIQSLWSGYGEVRRIRLDGVPYIVKHVAPPRDAHPRKLRSYQVELAFYRSWSTGSTARLPAFHGATSDGFESLFLLEDLDDAGFSDRTRLVGDVEIRLCLRWLAGFHASFLGRTPEGLWPIGTYWHLATRPDELRRMGNAELRRKAPELDARLNAARFQTLVHGDAKPANFCFRPDRLAVAAVDFQYVGGGCGIKDVAYFLGGWRTVRGLDGHLDVYFEALGEALPDHIEKDELEAEWRELYDVARLDFERFLDGWG